MRSNNFPDKEILDMPPDMEGVTRAKKDSKTKKYRFIVNNAVSYTHLTLPTNPRV